MKKLAVSTLVLCFACAIPANVLAQNLSDAALAQVGGTSAASETHAIGPQTIHSVPSVLVDDADLGNNANAIAGNPGGVQGVISVPNFTRSFSFNSQNFP